MNFLPLALYAIFGRYMNGHNPWPIDDTALILLLTFLGLYQTERNKPK